MEEENGFAWCNQVNSSWQTNMRVSQLKLRVGAHGCGSCLPRRVSIRLIARTGTIHSAVCTVHNAV